MALAGGDADVDVVFVAAVAGGRIAGSADLDNDDEIEVVVLNGAAAAGASTILPLPGDDGDDDIAFVGTGGAEATFGVDLDDDGEREIVLASTATAVGTVAMYDITGAAGLHVVVVGIEGGGRVRGVFDFLQDGGLELVVEADAMTASTVSGIDLNDDNPDIDVVFVATPGGAEVVAHSDLDNDGHGELLVGDPNIAVGSFSTGDLVGGSVNEDVRFIGVGPLGRLVLTVDIDGDGEREAVVENDDEDAGSVASGHIGDADADVDVLYVGTEGGGRVVGTSDLDGDDEQELIVENALRPPTSVIAGYLADGDADVDVGTVGVEGGAEVVGAADLDGDGEREVVVEDPAAASGSARYRYLADGDADADVVFAGTGGSSVITVLTPNVAIEWQAGSSQDVTWEATTLVGDVRILVSRDGGEVFEELVAATANDGLWTWEVAEPVSEHAVIRVASADFAEVFDDSDQPFTITSNPLIFADDLESGDLTRWSGSSP